MDPIRRDGRRARRRIRCRLLALLALSLTAPAVPVAHAQTASVTDVLAALRAEDLRVAAIGERLTLANRALCRDLVPRTGLQIHDLSQYAVAARGEARTFFGFEAPIAVEGVIAGSPADRAGIRAGDSIVRANGEILEAGLMDTGAAESTDRLVAADRRLQELAASGELRLDLLRQGQPLTISIKPETGCASRFEVVVKDGYDAQADGTTVQITTKMIEAIDNDDELAFVIAHELAHNILRHRIRLEEAKVDRGVFEAFGRSVGYIRRSEIEADILGIALMANAGYDPAAPARFWRWFGKAHYNSILLARTHPRWTLRAKLFDREAAAIAASSMRPYVPPILAERERPMSNDWQALVAGL